MATLMMPVFLIIMLCYIACVVQLINEGKSSRLTHGLEMIPEDSSSCLLLCCCIHCELV